MKYQTEINTLGVMTEGLNRNNVIILFDEDDKEYVKVLFFLHKNKGLNEEIKEGDTLLLDEKPYKIIYLGEWVNQRLDQTGHVTIELKSEENEWGPNVIIVEGEAFPKLKEGSTIEIV